MFDTCNKKIKKDDNPKSIRKFLEDRLTALRERIETLKKAIFNTSKNRNTLNFIENSNKYIELISDDKRLKYLWDSYQNNYEYAKNISFEDTIKALRKIRLCF